jgi:putative flippase GtrA
VVTVASLGLNILLFWLLVNFANIHYASAQIVTAAVIVLVNYYVNRTYTFSAGAAT